MGTLDRYLLREIALPFGIGLGLFCVVFAFSQLLEISDSVTGLGVGGGDVLQAFAYSFPPLLGVLIPVSALFATLIGVGRLASEREVLALSAAAVSPYRLLRVPLVFGLAMGLVSAFLLIYGEPWGVRGLRQLMAHGAQRALAQGVQVGEFQQWVPGVALLAQDKRDGRLRDVFFSDRRNRGRPLTIGARWGRIHGSEKAEILVFELGDGVILVRGQDGGSYRVVSFERAEYRLDVGRLVSNKARTLSPVQQKSIGQLWRDAVNPEHSASGRALNMVWFNRKLAFPLATVIFSLLAIPLGCTPKPGARARGFLVSAVMVGGYYYLGRAAELSARGGGLNPVVAAWLPNLLGLAGLAVLLWRFRRSAV